MELRHLRYFLVLAEELSFTRAARRLNIAQPALSIQIRNLEQEIGALLFIRSGRSVSLSEGGRAFLAHAQETLKEVERGLAAARSAAGGEVGHLSIGHNTTAEFQVFPHILPIFRARWPDIRLTLHSMRTMQQIEGLRRRQIDLGFMWTPVPRDEFTVEELVSTPLMAILPAAHPKAQDGELSIQALAGEPLALFSRAANPESFSELEQLFVDAGAQMNVVNEFDSVVSVINWVAMGMGVSLLPDYMRRIHIDGVVYRPLKPPTITKTLAIALPEHPSQAARNFYELTVATMRRFANGPALAAGR